MKYKIQKLQQRVDWLENGLNKIYQDLVSKPMKARDYKDAQRLLGLCQSISDGEPTTADSFNSNHLDKWEQEYWGKYDKKRRGRKDDI